MEPELTNRELPTQLQDLLPVGYSYKLKKWSPFEDKPEHFEAVILTNVYKEEEAQEWWHQFSIKSNATMRVRATCPKAGKVNAFKIYLRCLHQGRVEKSEHHQKLHTVKRNTNCPASMVVAIRRHIKYSRSRYRDPVDPVHPCEIQLSFIHNHSTNNAESLRFRPVSKDVEEKLLKLYQVGHSPTSALEMLKLELQVRHGADFFQIASDRYHLPDKSYCYRLFYKHFGKAYAASAEKDLANVLKDKVQYYNATFSEQCVAIEMDGDHYGIAVCSPLMKRAHSLSSSADVVYIETSISKGDDHCVFLLSTHTVAGAVPLGVVLTTSKKLSNLILGFQLLKQLLPDSEKAFCCKGSGGPLVFMVDCLENLSVALCNVWPCSDVNICTFSLLQLIWKFLWKDSQNILKNHRLYLLYLAKTLMFASSEVEVENQYQVLCDDCVSAEYPNYLSFMKTLWDKRGCWSNCCNLPPLQGASSYYEAAARTYKDRIFEEVRTFNTVQLLHYLVTHVDFVYRTKLLDIINNKQDRVFLSYFGDSIPLDVAEKIKQAPGNYFLVPREQGDSTLSTVDAELNVCSCTYGINGSLCMHQYWVFLKSPSRIFKVGFCDGHLKQKLLEVADGYQGTTQFVPSSISTQNPSTAFQQYSTEMPSELIPVCNSQSASITLVNNLNLSIDMPVTKVHFTTSGPKSSHPNLNQTFLNPDMNDTSQVVINGTGSQFSSVIEHADNNLVDIPNSIVTEESLPLVSNGTEERNGSTKDNVEMEERVTDMMEKFENFCQRVKDGLKSQPKDFLPALEIMMKTLERKGNSTDFLVSGLSFFGVLSAPSLQGIKRKRPLKPAGINCEVVIPKMNGGCQLLTYQRKRPLLPNPNDKVIVESKDVYTINNTDTLIS